MPYTTLAELSDRFGEDQLISLTDRAEVATGAIDLDVINRAIADADALIDGDVATRYQLPMATTPALLANIATLIAFWNLHLYDPSPKLKQDYGEAIDFLKSISKGQIKLDVAGVEPASSGNSGVQITDRQRPLEASKLTGFI